MRNRIIGSLRRHFLRGVLIVVPLILTYIVLRFLFQTVDGVLQPLIVRLLGHHIPGLGIFTTVLIIILAGVLTRNIVGASLYRMGDRLIAKVPLIRPIYSAAKQLLEAITLPTMKTSFKEVGLIEYPRRGTWAITFISNRIMVDVDGVPRSYFTVFIPSTPTPVSGFVLVVPESDVITLTMTLEEGIKFVVSGGVASPELLQAKLKRVEGLEQEVTGEAG